MKTFMRIIDTLYTIASIPVYWVYGIWITILYFVQHVLIFSINRTVDNLWYIWKKP